MRAIYFLLFLLASTVLWGQQPLSQTQATAFKEDNQDHASGFHSKEAFGVYVQRYRDQREDVFFGS